MHSSVRCGSVMKKHGRSLILLAIVTSMLMYIVSQDKTSPYTMQQGNDLVTITFTKEEVQDILNKEEVRQAVPVKAEQHEQYKEPVQPVRDITNVHSAKKSEPASGSVTQEHSKYLSKFEKMDFVVIKNKVFHKKDLNSSAAQAALISAGLVKTAKLPWPPVMQPSGASLLRQIDLSNYRAEDRAFLESRMEVYEERARHAGATCASFPDNQHKEPHTVHLVWDTKHQPNIVFCPNYKVASTTWMMYFLRLVHFNKDNPEIAKLPPEERDEARFSPRYGARQFKVFDYYIAPSSPQEKLSVFKQALRVIIVRHPFTRILSAYRDKMVKMKPKPEEFKFRDLQLQIIAKYRKPNSDEKSPHPTFAEFVQHVIDSTANLKNSRDWQSKIKCWTPYWSQCEVCSSDFNYIMKLETMLDDERFLITLANLKELKKLKELEWRHKRTASSSDVAPEFYNQITQEQMRLLYQRYKLDFEIFDYHIDDYLAIAKDA